MEKKITSMPVLFVDRDDITTAGFDGESVSNEQLIEIADALNTYYIDNFYSVLYDTCKLHKVKPLND